MPASQSKHSGTAGNRGSVRLDGSRFFSILFDQGSDRASAQHAAQAASFIDLNLDQILDAVTASWTEYNLRPLLSFPLNRVDAIHYRHEVFRDLEDPALLECVATFAQQMREVRKHLATAAKLHYRHHQEAWFLYAVQSYCEAIRLLESALCEATLQSRGLLAFREYLRGYATDVYFTSLLKETKTLQDDLSEVKYCVLIRDNAFTVRSYEGEKDYSAEIEETFEKFKQGAVTDYRVKYRSSPENMNHIESKILEFVANLYPELFSRLDDYCARHAHFIEETIAGFDREIHFYAAYLEHIASLKKAGLPFCYPRISGTSKQVHSHEGFDLALAHKLVAGKAEIVRNDFFLKGEERIVVVTGPNQGGKTTFARMFGQLHYLASIGCPVPGRDAQLFLFDQIFTHFEREEKVETLRGKLEDDLTRIHAILERATSRSIVVMNEIFTSTTLRDEIFLSKRVMAQILGLDVLCVWVTFVDELASLSDHTVSMVSTIHPDNPAVRTFRIERRPADGLAYAMAIAQKYGLTYGRVKERLAS